VLLGEVLPTTRQIQERILAGRIGNLSCVFQAFSGPLAIIRHLRHGRVPGNTSAAPLRPNAKLAESFRAARTRGHGAEATLPAGAAARFYVGWAACNAKHAIESRLCRWLLRTRDLTESEELPLTQEFLAQMLGVRRTSVTFEAKKLHQAGLIQYRRGRVRLIDREGLEECACECYRAIREQQKKLITSSRA
jgi:hypothetical protein